MAGHGTSAVHLCTSNNGMDSSWVWFGTVRFQRPFCVPNRRNSFRQTLQKSNESRLLFEYPFDESASSRVSVYSDDLQCLQPDCQLNDTIIDFSLRMLVQVYESSHPELKFHIFNSFFYRKWSSAPPQERWHAVRKWTRSIDIFDLDYILMPVCEG